MIGEGGHISQSELLLLMAATSHCLLRSFGEAQANRSQKRECLLGVSVGGKERNPWRKIRAGAVSMRNRVFFCEEDAWVSFGRRGLLVGRRGFAARGVNILFYIGHLFIISICVSIKRRDDLGLAKELNAEREG